MKENKRAKKDGKQLENYSFQERCFFFELFQRSLEKILKKY